MQYILTPEELAARVSVVEVEMRDVALEAARKIIPGFPLCVGGY